MDIKLSCLGMLNTWYAKLGLPEQNKLVITPEFLEKLDQAKSIYNEWYRSDNHDQLLSFWWDMSPFSHFFEVPHNFTFILCDWIRMLA